MDEIFNPKSLSINKLFTDADSLYQVPKYQRPYKWENDQVDKLWDDLWESYQNEESNYFLGSIITAKSADGGSYLDIVDGQQRMTTLIILFATIRDLYPNINYELSETDPKAITNSKIKNAILQDERFGRLRLFTHSNHQSDFDTIIVKGDINGLKRPYKKDIRNAEEPKYKFINTAVIFRNNLHEIGEVEAGKFTNYIFNKIKIIRIDCTDVGFAIKLFQVLNARGLDLTNSDLIKSYLLNKLYSDYDESTRSNREEQFLSNWKACEKIATETDDGLNSLFVVYEYYLLESNPKKSLYDELQKQFEKKDPIDVITDFCKFCTTYKDEIYNSNDPALFSFFYLGWGIYWKSILLAALHTNYPEYEVLKFEIRIFFYLHWIAGYTLTKIKQTSFNLIKAVKDREPISEIKRDIEKILETNSVQKRVEESLAGQVYQDRWLKPLLFMIEFNQMDNPSNLSISDRNIHVEHILPQNFKKKYGWSHIIDDNQRDGDDYVHTIGNLTLLSGRKNIQASDDTFPNKVSIYSGKGKHSDTDEKVTSFRISQMLVDDHNKGEITNWDYGNMKKRRNFMYSQIEVLLKIDLSKIKNEEL